MLRLFLENVKMEKQRTSLPYPVLMKRILGQGIRGFEAGLVPWGVVLGLTKGTVLGGSKVEIQYWCQKAGLAKKNADLVSGFGAGAVQGVFMSPILLARTRVNQSLTERAAQAGVVKTTVFEEMKLSSTVLFDAVRKEGVMVLTSGMATCVFKRAMDWGTRFIFINMFRDYMKTYRNSQGQNLSEFDKLNTAFFGGAASVLVTMPVDRLMPVLQSANREAGASVLQIVRKKLATEGITTMWRGGLFRTIHTGYHTTFAIFVADKMYDLVK
eukprot:Colp12_sorted_trinity150504_noHs@27287